MTIAQIVETSVTNNSSFQNYTHPEDHTTRTTDTPGFKPFTLYQFYLKMLWNSLLDLMSGHCALMVTTCKVWGSALVRQPICSTLTRQNVATLRVIQTVMNTVTIKMSHIPSTIKVGASANRRATSWLASTKATATIFIASKNFDAARWKKVNLITTWKVSEYSKNSKYAMGSFTKKDVGNRICTFLYTIIHLRSFQRCKS